MGAFWGSWNTSVLPTRKYKGIDTNKTLLIISRKVIKTAGYLLNIYSPNSFQVGGPRNPRRAHSWVWECNFCPVMCMGTFHGASSLKATRACPSPSSPCLSHLPFCFWNADEIAVAEAHILNHVLTLEIEAIQTEHQDQRVWPTRTSQSRKGGVWSPYSYFNLVASSWSAMAR